MQSIGQDGGRFEDVGSIKARFQAQAAAAQTAVPAQTSWTVEEGEPVSPDIRLLRIMAYKKDGDFAGVIREVDAALKEYPGNPDLLNEKAFAQNRIKDFNSALGTAETAIQAEPANAAAYANKGFALGGLGDRPGMVGALTKASSLDPRFKEILRQVLDSTGDTASLYDLMDGPSAPRGRAAPISGIPHWAFILGIGTIVLPLLLFLLPKLGFGEGGRSPDRIVAPGPIPAPSASGAPAGRAVLSGKYELGPRIGEGGMGVVFEGMDRSLGRKVAIKMMLPQIAADEKLRARFISEARIVAALSHPNIVAIHEIVEEGKDIYLIFDLVAGRSLASIISQNNRIPFAAAVRIIRDACAAVAAAHGRGIIHRDLKPSNMMIDETGAVKVMDFGLARMTKDSVSEMALTNTVVGTTPYMAPEQENGAVCAQSDIYSLAVTLYEMLAGRRPFAGMGGAMTLNKRNMVYDPISDVVPGLPPGLDAFFSHALAAEPGRRIHGPKEFISELDALPR